MRLYVVAIGAVVTLSGVYYMLQEGGIMGNPSGPNGLTAMGLGIIDSVLGLIMARPSKVSAQTGPGSIAKVLIDRGVYGTSVYQLAFFDHKLVLKRLATSRTTVLLGLLLTIAGAVLETGNLLVGAAAGGLTGYVVQEFVTQKRRERILKDNSLGSTGLGDVEFLYENVDDFQVRGNRMMVSVADRVFRINLPRGYTRTLGPVLARMVPSFYEKLVTRLEKDL
ncbi:hypothetical protein E6H36_06175 [Candidatus Bathyarchaeota archaeon]|nr:MAG: hypothetical protein E6H36_06175 [Candidatus Bathyarchaeota archaeon]